MTLVKKLKLSNNTIVLLLCIYIFAWIIIPFVQMLAITVLIYAATLNIVYIMMKYRKKAKQ